MNITFLTKYPIIKNNEGLYSPGASARLRVISPALELIKYGHHVRITTIPNEQRKIDFDNDSDLYILSKITNPVHLEQIFNFFEFNKDKLLIIDICDNRFETDIYHKLFVNLVDISKGVFCNSLAMSKIIEKHSKNKKIEILPEPIEGDELSRKKIDTQNVRLLWFGHQDGLIQLIKNYQKIQSISQVHSLHVVTSPTKEVLLWLHQINSNPENSLPVIFSPWSINGLRNAAKITDISILPGSNENFWLTKSPNRLLQSLWYGLRVAAFPFDSYLNFKDHICIDSKIEGAILKAINLHPNSEYKNMLNSAHTPNAIGKAWSLSILNIVKEQNT
jgi:hypothetical protein